MQRVVILHDVSSSVSIYWFFFYRFNLEEIFLQNFDAVHHVNSTSEVYVQEVCNPFHVTLSKQHRTSTEGT